MSRFVLGSLRFILWSLKWTFATVFFVAVMGASGYYVFTQAVASGEHVTVPNIVGMPITRASYLLAEKGLEAGQQSHIYSDSFPEYHVMAQRPPAGQVVRSGRKVFPTVSAGHEYETAPDLTGLNLEQARSELERQRFQPGSVARMPHGSDAGTVLAQDPQSGSNILGGGAVHLLVSDGPAWTPTLMPDLVGMPVLKALELLATENVTAIPTAVDRPGEPYDVVLSQSVEPATRLREKDVVFFDVRLSGAITLPNLRRKIDLDIKVTDEWHERNIRIDVIDKEGRVTILPKQEEYDAGVRQKFAAGTTLGYKNPGFVGDLTLEVYVDERLARTYHYRGTGGPPVIENHPLPERVR